MSNISVEHKQKLQQFLYSDDFETVIQGLDLLDTVAEDENDIYDVFNLSDKILSTVDGLARGICNCVHWIYFKVWMLGKLTEYNVDWVCNLTSLDLSNNQLTSLPESIENLIHLEYLELERNRIQYEERIRLTKIFGRVVYF